MQLAGPDPVARGGEDGLEQSAGHRSDCRRILFLSYAPLPVDVPPDGVGIYNLLLLSPGPFDIGTSSSVSG